MGQEEVIEKALESIGLVALDRRLYQACLELGNPSVSELSRKLSVERRTVYSSLERLKKQGLLNGERQAYDRGVCVQSPDKIISLLEKGKTSLAYAQYQLEEALPNLLAAYSQAGSLDGFKIYKGKKQVVLALDELLAATKKEINYLGDYAALLSWLGGEYEMSWQRKRIRRKINIKMQVYEEVFLAFEKEDNASWLREIRFLLLPQKTTSSLYLSGERALFVDPNQGEAILISEVAFSKLLTLFFWFGWGN